MNLLVFFLLGFVFAYLSPPQFNGNYPEAMWNNRFGEEGDTLIRLEQLGWLLENHISCFLGYTYSWISNPVKLRIIGLSSF